MAFGMDFDTWAKKWDPSKLGGVQSSYGLNPTWSGSGEDSLSASLPLWVTNTPAAMQKLGLTQADFGLVPGYQAHDSLVPDQWNLSDKAKKALAGWSVDSLAYGGGQHVNVLRDADGNILNMSKPLKTGPDLLEKAVTAIGLAGAGGILAQGLGFLSPTINPLQLSTWGGGVNLGPMPLESTAGSGIFDSIISGAKSVGSFFEGSSLARTLLSTAGAGVMQMSAEKAADKALKSQAEERQKDRDWQDKRDADKRLRAMPVAGMLGRARVITGGGNGG